MNPVVISVDLLSSFSLTAINRLILKGYYLRLPFSSLKQSRFFGGLKKGLSGARNRIGISWHRYYDPSTGRYLTPDPIGLDGGINLFVYALNNSVMFIDPSGLHGLMFFARPPITFRPSPSWRAPIGPRPPFVRPKVTPRQIPRQIFRPPPEIIKPQPKPWYWQILRLFLRNDPVEDITPTLPPINFRCKDA